MEYWGVITQTREMNVLQNGLMRFETRCVDERNPPAAFMTHVQRPAIRHMGSSTIL